MNKKKLAICIPTYNRAQVIEELCLKVLPYLSKNEIDLYIYDSSPENDTFDVCIKYKEIYNNLFYKKLNSRIHSNEKIYLIYQEFQKKNYQYIWMWGDAVRWSQKMIERILIEVEKDYDVIVTYYDDKEKIGTKEYYDARMFHMDCAWMMTWYGATVINTKILNIVDWNSLKSKYLQDDSINFSQIGLFFEAIYVKKDAFYGLFISTTNYDMRVSALKRHPGWYYDIFKVFCERWRNAMCKLPDYYEKKESIRKLGVYSGLFTLDNMLNLKKEKIYNAKLFFHYFFTWRKVTRENIFALFIAAILPGRIAGKFTCAHKLEKKLDEIFEKTKKYDEIWIYGCGYNSITIVEYMEKRKLNIKGYLVSSAQYEMKRIGEYDVVEYSDDVFKSSFVAVIISTGEVLRNEILATIPERFQDRVFYLK